MNAEDAMSAEDAKLLAKAIDLHLRGEYSEVELPNGQSINGAQVAKLLEELWYEAPPTN